MEIQWRRISLESFVLGYIVMHSDETELFVQSLLPSASDYVLIQSPISFGLLLSHAALVLGPFVDYCSSLGQPSVCRNVKYMKLHYSYAELTSASS